MNILVFGNGAREHCICSKLLESKLDINLFLAEPNDGFKDLGKVLEFENFLDLAKKAKKEKVDFAIVGPEMPLSLGICDEFEKIGIKICGCNKQIAKLESSKSFAKKFMQKHSIKTARFVVIEKEDEIDKKFEQYKKFQTCDKFVLKADGLAFGKGVCIFDNENDAKEEVKLFLKGKLGVASKKVLLEEFQTGEEFSLISIFDGKTLLPFLLAKDFKRLNESESSPNTGGMGAICPCEISKVMNRQLQTYIKKLQNALIKERFNFTGFIYSGLIYSKDSWKVLEYNMRLGDPECQVLLECLDVDLVWLMQMAFEKKLSHVSLKWKKEPKYCIVVASEGYPYKKKAGDLIFNVEEIKSKYNVKVFFGSVRLDDKLQLISNGGRVLCVVGNDSRSVLKAVENLEMKNKVFRRDIM